MTITDVKCVNESGQWGAEGPSYTRTYHVFFTSGYSAGALRSNTDSRLPKPGEFHKDTTANTTVVDASARAESISFELDEDSYNGSAGIASYTVEYGPIPAAGWAENPTSRPAEIEWGGSDITETVSKDSEGNPLVNSAGDLYDPLPERPIKGGQCTITRYESANPANTCVNYSNSCNAATWYGVAAGNAQFGVITSRKVVEGTYTVWQVTYPIRFRRDTWRLKLIDNGYRLLNGDGDPTTATDGVGQSTQVPVLLDGTGGVLPPGGTPVVYPSAGYKLNDETTWASLGLPNPFA